MAARFNFKQNKYNNMAFIYYCFLCFYGLYSGDVHFRFHPSFQFIMVNEYYPSSRPKQYGFIIIYFQSFKLHRCPPCGFLSVRRYKINKALTGHQNEFIILSCCYLIYLFHINSHGCKMIMIGYLHLIYLLTFKLINKCV